MKKAVYRFLTVGLLCSIGAIGQAQADNVVFDASGQFDDLAILGGTLTIDTAAGSIVSSALTISNAGTFDQVGSTSPVEPYDSIPDYFFGAFFHSSALPGAFLDLYIDLGPVNSLIGYTGGRLGTADTVFAQSFYTLQTDPGLTSGTLTAEAAPEPSTVFLIAVPVAWFTIRRGFSSARGQGRVARTLITAHNLAKSL